MTDVIQESRLSHLFRVFLLSHMQQEELRMKLQLLVHEKVSPRLSTVLAVHKFLNVAVDLEFHTLP